MNGTEHTTHEWCSPLLDKGFCGESGTATWFCAHASSFLLFLFPYHPVSSRTFCKTPSSMYFSTTQDYRDQALRKTYNENFVSSLGMFLASPPHVSKNREPKTTLSHSKLALPQSTSMFPTPPTSRDVLLQRAVRRGAGWMLSPFLMILAYVFCSCMLHGSF